MGYRKRLVTWNGFSSKIWISSNLWFNSFMVAGGPCLIQTSPLIWRANQSTGFYMIGTFVRKELNFVRNINAVWKVFVCGVILVRILPHTDWIRRDTVVMLIGYGQEHENVSIFNRFWCSHLIFRACILISHFNVMKILNALLKTYESL